MREWYVGVRGLSTRNYIVSPGNLLGEAALQKGSPDNGHLRAGPKDLCEVGMTARGCKKHNLVHAAELVR